MFSRTARKSRSERNCSGFFLCRGIIKRCTPLGSKCTPHRPFVKWYRGVKRKRLHGDHFRTTVEPVIVKRYRKTLANRGFCKKKLDTRFDTHCIKTGVQLWCARQESNLHSSRNWNLNPTRLPVPPRAHIKFSAFFNLLGSSRENFTVVTLPKSIAYANFATGAYIFRHLTSNRQ